jgi:hypothetical protein
MNKLLDAGCHVVATMWKALKREWHWLGCAKPATLGSLLLNPDSYLKDKGYTQTDADPNDKLYDKKLETDMEVDYMRVQNTINRMRKLPEMEGEIRVGRGSNEKYKEKSKKEPRVKELDPDKYKGKKHHNTRFL